MQRVYLFSGNALPLYSSRWGVTEWKRYFNSSNNDDEPIGQKKHTSDNKRRPSVNLSKFKICRTKRNKKKADYLKGIRFNYFENNHDIRNHIINCMQDVDFMKNVESNALQNDPKSQLTLARCYLMGYKSNPDIGLSIYWAKLAASKNSAAKRFLAFIYLFYIKNYQRAYRLFSELAEKGEVFPQFMTELLQALYNEKMHISTFIKNKISIFRNPAKDGTPEKASACYLLGLCYYCGITGKPNIKKAFQYLRRAAELGVENANFLVGNIYEHGFACKRSVIEATKFYQVAAKNNNQWAIYHLGRLYYQGKLLEKDLAKAISYFKQGYEAGFIPSKSMFERISNYNNKDSDEC